MKETSEKNLWKTLKEKYMKKSLENRLYMKKKLSKHNNPIYPKLILTRALK